MSEIVASSNSNASPKKNENNKSHENKNLNIPIKLNSYSNVHSYPTIETSSHRDDYLNSSNDKIASNLYAIPSNQQCTNCKKLMCERSLLLRALIYSNRNRFSVDDSLLMDEKRISTIENVEEICKIILNKCETLENCDPDKRFTISFQGVENIIQPPPLELSTANNNYENNINNDNDMNKYEANDDEIDAKIQMRAEFDYDVKVEKRDESDPSIERDDSEFYVFNDDTEEDTSSSLKENIFENSIEDNIEAENTMKETISGNEQEDLKKLNGTLFEGNQDVNCIYNGSNETTPISIEDTFHQSWNDDTSSLDSDWNFVEKKDVLSYENDNINTSVLYKNVDKSLQTLIHSTQEKKHNSGILDKFSVNIKQIASNWIYGNNNLTSEERTWMEWIEVRYEMKPDAKRIKKAMLVKSLDEILFRMRKKRNLFREFNYCIDSFIKFLSKKYRTYTNHWVDAHLSTKDLKNFSKAFATLMTSHFANGQGEEGTLTVYSCIVNIVIMEVYEHFAELFLNVDSNELISKRIVELCEHTTIHALEICPEMCLPRKRYDEVYVTAINHLKHIEYTLNVFEQMEILYQSYLFIFHEFDEYYLKYNSGEFEKGIVIESNEITKILAFVFLASGIEVLPCIVSIVTDLVDNSMLTEEQKFMLHAARVALNWIIQINFTPAFIQELKKREMENLTLSSIDNLSTCSNQTEITDTVEPVDECHTSSSTSESQISSQATEDYENNRPSVSSPLSQRDSSNILDTKPKVSSILYYDLRNIFQEISTRKQNSK